MTNARRSYLIVSLLFLSVVIAGCTGRDRTSRTPAAGDTASDQSQAADSGGTEDAGTGRAGTDASDLNGLRVLYFDFDRSEVRAEYRGALTELATQLASSPRLRVALEGHADERGSREYNIGLGERRAQSVRRLLLLGGTGEDQVSTVSYGEERPASGEHDDRAWQLNRRVEIRIAGRP